MATIILSLSAKTDKITLQHEVLIRFFHGRINQRAKTNIFVNLDYWDDIHQTIIIPKWRTMTEERTRIKTELQKKLDQISQVTRLIHTAFQESGAGKRVIAKNWLKSLINDFNFPKRENAEKERRQSFFDVFSSYICERDFSLQRKKHFWVVWRTLKRYEIFNGVELTFDSFTDDTLRSIEHFYKEEYIICKSPGYEKIMSAVPHSRLPRQRGKNTINCFMRHVRAFIYWAIDRGVTSNNPFKKYKIIECVYGTPIYITIAERNKLYHHDFSATPHLARQRDIFVFQCLIGCRVGDLWSMTKSNIVNGAVEYIPRKTKEEDAITVRVPLNTIACEILKRYDRTDDERLLPFTTLQHYNKDIKTIFKESGLTRIVTVINPTTREEQKRPIYEVASSHLARRCFIGNLYKKVKDPNLIGKLSGHKEGSKAFARYREIDEDMCRELVTMLE